MIIRKLFYDKLSDLDNLYTIEISEEQLKNENVVNWVNNIITTESGKFIDQSEFPLRPVSLYPYFKLQNDIGRLRWENQLGIGYSLINNLHELTIHLNGSAHGNEQFAKQTIYPFPSSESIPIKEWINFLQSCKGGMLHKVHLTGNAIAYAQLKELGAWLDEYIPEWTVYQLASDFIAGAKFIDKIRSVRQWVVICDDLSLLNPVNSLLKQCPDLTYSYVFPLTSEEVYEQIIAETEKHKIIDYSAIPLFNGENIAFFEKYIYTTIDDFRKIQLSKREVFAHQVLNTATFGKLTVLSDGKVYANLNHEALGTINDPVYDLLYKEIDTGASWRMIRNQKPCSDCVYQWLCPSPSNYELVIGKSNLCHVKTNRCE